MRHNPETSISEHFSHAVTRCEQQIASTPHEEVIAADVAQWVDELCEPFYLPIIEEAGSPTWDTETGTETHDDYGQQMSVECQYIVVDWPLKDDPRLTTIFNLRPSRYDVMLPEYSYFDGHIRFRIRIGTVSELQREHVQTAAKQTLERTINGIREDFASRNKDMEKWGPILPHAVEEAVKRRKQQVGQKEDAMQQLAASIQIPLRKRMAAPPKVVTLKPAPAPKRRAASPRTPTEVEITLEKSGFTVLLNCFERYMRDCERTPGTFAKLEEEDIRNLLLPYLNQLFEGGATGETFSKAGKTDIYLVVQKGCILICECKWWRGPKSVEEVSGQVLKRVTWRENFGIVLIFVKERIDVVLERVKSAIESLDANQTKNVQTINPTHFVATLMLPEAKSKTVEVHYLVCNFSV